jgi:hypothetical protein
MYNLSAISYSIYIRCSTIAFSLAFLAEMSILDTTVDLAGAGVKYKNV